jgi:hypothetical protein
MAETCMFCFSIAFAAKASLISIGAKSEPILTAIFGVLVLLAASFIRRLTMVEPSEGAPEPNLPKQAPAGHIPDFQVPEVPPSRVEISEQAVG